MKKMNRQVVLALLLTAAMAMCPGCAGTPKGTSPATQTAVSDGAGQEETDDTAQTEDGAGASETAESAETQEEPGTSDAGKEKPGTSGAEPETSDAGKEKPETSAAGEEESEPSAGEEKPGTFDAGEEGQDTSAAQKDAAPLLKLPDVDAVSFPVIDGSTATLPISQALYRLVTGATAEEARAAIRHNKTSQAYYNLVQAGKKGGFAAVSLVIACEPGDEVRGYLEEEGDPLLIKPIGRDALVFLANASNPATSLTGEQIADFYAGRADNWSAAGGDDRPVTVFQQPSGSGSQNLMMKLVMEDEPMAEPPMDYVMSEMGEPMEYVSAYDNTAGAIGYADYYYVKNMYGKQELKFLEVDGVMPENDTIRDGSYPYTGDFYAAIRKNQPKNSAAYKLFVWLTSEDGQALINGLGYVGVTDDVRTLPETLAEPEEKEEGIALPEGHVIVADGRYLLGETGTAVYDGNMELIHFYPGMVCENKPDIFEQDASEALLMTDYSQADGETPGRKGIFSLADGKWAYKPSSDYICEAADGFFIWSYEQEDGKAYFADRKGRVIRFGEAAEERYAAGFIEIYSNEQYAEAYPVLAKRFGSGEDELFLQYDTSGPAGAVFLEDDTAYFYDMNGKRQLYFDTEGKNPPDSYYKVENVGGGKLCLKRAYLDDFSRTVVQEYYLYENGRQVKSLTSSKNKEILRLDESFYTAECGNYVCIFDYSSDRICASFLLGESRND